MSNSNNLDQFAFADSPKPNLVTALPNGSHIYCLALKEGVQVPPHTGPGKVYIMMSEGQCDFTLEGKVSHLKAGDLFEFDGRKEHSLKAVTDFKTLVITTFSFSEVEFKR